MHSKLNLCTFYTVMRQHYYHRMQMKIRVYSRIYCSFNLRSKKRILFGNIYIIYCARSCVQLFVLEYADICDGPIWSFVGDSRSRARVEIMKRIKNYALQNLKRDTGGLGQSFFLSTRGIATRSLKGTFRSNNSVRDKIWISNISLSIDMTFNYSR